MFGFNAPRQRPGRRVFTAAINRPLDEVARQSRARPGGALGRIEAAGAGQDYSTRRRSWLVRITDVEAYGSGFHRYGWNAIYPVVDSPGNYQDYPDWSSTTALDPLYELNGYLLAVDMRAEVSRDFTSGLLVTFFPR